MKIEEFADIIGADIVIRRYSNQNGRYTASFDRCEVKGDGVLIGAYGAGKSPEEAINDYITKIVGKKIVFNAMNDKRQEFNVPSELSYEQN